MGRPKSASPKIAIDKDFAARLEQACDTNPLIPPYNFGRLGWIQEKLQKDHGITASRETVRKWIAGEARPRHKKMTALAKIVKADEAWLALGKAPDMPEVKSEKRARGLEGVVYYVAGVVGLNGASLAFTDPASKDAKSVHFYSIIDGVQHKFYASLARESNGIRFISPTDFEDVNVIGVVQKGDFSFDLYHISPSAISKFGNRKGGYIEITAIDHDGVLKVKSEECPRVETFRDMVGR